MSDNTLAVHNIKYTRPYDVFTQPLRTLLSYTTTLGTYPFNVFIILVAIRKSQNSTAPDSSSDPHSTLDPISFCSESRPTVRILLFKKKTKLLAPFYEY